VALWRYWGFSFSVGFPCPCQKLSDLFPITNDGQQKFFDYYNAMVTDGPALFSQPQAGVHHRWGNRQIPPPWKVPGRRYSPSRTDSNYNGSSATILEAHFDSPFASRFSCRVGEVLAHDPPGRRMGSKSLMPSAKSCIWRRVTVQNLTSWYRFREWLFSCDGHPMAADCALRCRNLA
jgi:hypothetical protein